MTNPDDEPVQTKYCEGERRSFPITQFAAVEGYEIHQVGGLAHFALTGLPFLPPEDGGPSPHDQRLPSTQGIDTEVPDDF